MIIIAIIIAVVVFSLWGELVI